MATVEYGGRAWSFRAASPVDAISLIEADSHLDYWNLLIGALSPGEGPMLAACMKAGAVPSTAVTDLIEEWLEVSTGMPISAVGALSNTCVKEWPMIRGRMVRDGLHDPLQQIVSLGALLSAVWDMMLEGCKDEKEVKKLRGKVFKPRIKRRAGPSKANRRVTNDERRSQDAMLSSLLVDE